MTEILIEFLALDGSRRVATRSETGEISVEKIDDDQAISEIDSAAEIKVEKEWLTDWLA